MRMAYLVPEFPGQTHAFFWRERAALRRLGITTYVLSTRRPPKSIISHDWSARAESETFYLADVRLLDLLEIASESIRLGGKAWIRAIRASIEDCPPRAWPFNIVLLFSAIRLITFMRARKLT